MRCWNIILLITVSSLVVDHLQVKTVYHLHHSFIQAAAVSVLSKQFLQGSHRSWWGSEVGLAPAPTIHPQQLATDWHWLNLFLVLSSCCPGQLVIINLLLWTIVDHWSRISCRIHPSSWSLYCSGATARQQPLHPGPIIHSIWNEHISFLSLLFDKKFNIQVISNQY